MISFDDALAKARRARDKAKGYKLGYRTRLREEGGLPIIYHFFTPIVIPLQDGRYLINTGGYETVSTMRRLEEYAPVSMHRRNWRWVLVPTHGYEVGWPFSIHGLWPGEWLQLLPPNMT